LGQAENIKVQKGATVERNDETQKKKWLAVKVHFKHR